MNPIVTPSVNPNANPNVNQSASSLVVCGCFNFMFDACNFICAFNELCTLARRYFSRFCFRVFLFAARSVAIAFFLFHVVHVVFRFVS